MTRSEDEEFLREYYFPSAGYIPGIPGIWPGGSVVTIDERTLCVVALSPGHIQVSEQARAAEEQPAPETPPALPDNAADTTIVVSKAAG